MPARTVRSWPWAIIARIAAGIAVAAIAGIVIYRVFVLPDQLRTQAQEAKQDTKAAEATINTMEVGQGMMEERERTIERTRTIVRENEREILAAPGANEAVPPAVHDAFRNSIGRLREQADQRQRSTD